MKPNCNPGRLPKYREPFYNNTQLFGTKGDLGWTSASPLEYRIAVERGGPIRTPSLKRLAERGVLFTRAYCASPACNPSRVAVLTGKRPSTTGVYGNRSDWRGAMPAAVTLMQCFMAHGYRVEGAGEILHHQQGSAFHDQESFHRFLMMPERQDAPMPVAKLSGLGWYGSPKVILILTDDK